MSSGYTALAFDPFLRWAERTPSARALESGESHLTYGDLERASRILAVRLRERGLQDEDVCAVSMATSLPQVVAALAVMRAGGTYLPIDPELPDERREYIRKAGAARVVLTAGGVTSGPSDDVVAVEVGELVAAQASGSLPHVEPDQAAYVIFTSGTTGRPKGVVVSHRGVAPLAKAQIGDFALGPDSRVLLFAPVGFDAAIAELFATLGAGGCGVVPAPDERMPGPVLSDALRSHAITAVTLPPAALAVTEPDDLPCLATVVSAGERCTEDIVRRWGFGRRFVNAYGPTEITVCATEGVCDGDGAPSIGAALGHVVVRVLDGDLLPVADGEAGELCIGGPGVARGYKGRPDLTAERFVPDPAGVAGARLYRTGDLACRRGDGAYDYRGRVDRQRKVRGYRIEPEEIEVTLSRHPGVLDCAVVIDDATEFPRIVAYVAATDPLTEDDVLAYARDRLPGYMVPAAAVVVDALPTTANGKLDHAALPRPRPRTPRRPPRDDIERALVEMWERVLGRMCGTDENFFEVGGNSIAALELRLLIEKELGCALPPALLVDKPTITALGDVVRGQVEAPRHPDLIVFHPESERPPLFMCAPVSGSALCYLTVSRLLGDAIPLVGLQAPGLDGRAPILDSIEALALHHVDAILERWPAGPYVIGGWSMGGTIAFEMARQLAARGASVARTILVEATSPAQASRAKTMLEDFRESATDTLYVNNFARCLGHRHGPFSDSSLDGLEVEERRAAVISALRGLGAPDLGREAWDRHLEVFRVTLAAFLRYFPTERYQGAVRALRATDPHPVLGADTSDWREFTGSDYQDTSVPGNHFTVLTGANASAVADELAAIYGATIGRAT